MSDNQTYVTLDVAKKTVLDCILDMEPFYIHGQPGLGKSDSVRQVAAELGMKLIDARASQLDPTDIRGLPWVDKDKNMARWAPPSFLPDVERDGERGILFLDELSSAPPATQAALYELILDRRSGEYTLPDGWVVGAAGNRLGDRGVVFRLSTALANRLSHIYVTPSVPCWRQWAINNDIDPRIIGFLQLSGEAKLTTFDPKVEGEAFASPRTWAKASKLTKRRLVGDAVLNPDPSLFAGLAGRIGIGVTHEFLAYARLTERLPAVTSLLDDGQIPRNLSEDLLHTFLAGILSHLLNSIRTESVKLQDQITNAARYIRSLPDNEFAVLFLGDVKENKDLAFAFHSNKEYRQMMLDNSRFLLNV